ncbi:MAG: hypothetical protein A2Z69_02350 [Bacteroidetes bacterium RBG_13_44_24]|nr:MAG: hypothetical protein A2Z69_02350 [Bacteroidetes bacterium RBG_13_44_24]
MRKYAHPIRVGYRIVGYVKGDKFYKVVDGREHFLHNPPAIAFDIGSLEDARDYGASYVHIFDTARRRSHYALISTILEKGFRINRGSGEQIALLMTYWEKEAPHTQPDLFLREETQSI